jgi:hypothetical protein
MKNIFLKLFLFFALILVLGLFGKRYFLKPVLVFGQTSQTLQIINGGFENDTNNWWFWNPSNGNWMVDSSEKKSGTKSIKVTLGSGVCDFCYNPPPHVSCINQGRHQNENPAMWLPSLFINKTFAFSYWYKTSSSTIKPTLQIALRKEDGNYIYWWVPGVLQSDSSSNKWSLASKAVTIPQTVDGKNVTAFDVSICVSGNPGDSIWIDDVVTYRPAHYSAVVVAEKPIVVDYSYSDGERAMAFLNKAQRLAYADKKIFLPRVLKQAYGKNFNSGIVVMNTEGRETTVSLKILNNDGGSVLKEYSFNLPAFGFKGIWPPSYSDWPTNPQDPPAIIESTNTKIVADVDLRSTENVDGGQRGGAYEGISQKITDKVWYVPIILRDAYNEGWESGIIIQNTENRSTNLTISLYGLDDNYQKTCGNISLGAYGQLIIYFPINSLNYCFSDLASGKRYSAKIISSTTKIAVVQSHSSFSKEKQLKKTPPPKILLEKNC